MMIVSQGYLQIDDTLVKGKSVEGLLTLDVAPRVYLGGLPDMSEVMERSGAGPEAEASLARYRGCMRSLYINEASYPLKVIRGRTGANIQDCDGTVCGGEVSVTHDDGLTIDNYHLRFVTMRECVCWTRRRSLDLDTIVSVKRATLANIVR